MKQYQKDSAQNRVALIKVARGFPPELDLKGEIALKMWVDRKR